jgi:hypothetical protein
LGDGEKYELEYSEEIYILQQYPLCYEQDLVDEEDKEKKHERYAKGEQILSAYMSVHQRMTFIMSHFILL